MFPLLALLLAQGHPPDSALQQAINDAQPGDTVELPSGPIQWPLRIEGAQNLRIVAQPDTELQCGDDQERPCLLIQDSKGVRIEGLQIAGQPYRRVLGVQDSTDIVLDGVRIRQGRLRVDNAQVRIQSSTLADLDAPMLESHKGGAEVEITASHLIAISFYPHTAPDWLHMHHNNVFLSHEVRGANVHHNLVQGWPPRAPLLDRNLTMLDPGFVDPNRGDLRVQVGSPALEGFGVPGARVPVEDGALSSIPWGREVLGWSPEGLLLVHTEPLDTGHGFCATVLSLWDAKAKRSIDSVGCAFDEGPFNSEMALQAAAHYAPVLAQAAEAGVRGDLGQVARIQTRTTHLEDLERNSETGQSTRRSLVWIDRGQHGLDQWWEVREDFEFGLPFEPSTLTQSPDGTHLIWISGEHLVHAPTLPTPKASCGIAGVVRGTSLLPENHQAELYTDQGKTPWGGSYGPIRYAGRVSCGRSGEGDKEGVWVQALDGNDQVFWLHSSQLPDPPTWSKPVERPPADEVRFSSPGSPRPLNLGALEQAWGVLGWSSEGLVLTHAGIAPTALTTTTTLTDTRSEEAIGQVQYTWPEHDFDARYAQAWTREAAFAEILALANAKGIRPEIGHTQKVLLLSVDGRRVCVDDGGGPRALLLSSPMETWVEDLGPWLSTGPTGTQVLVGDTGAVRSVRPGDWTCPGPSEAP